MYLAKERLKIHYKYNKFHERCFLCKSVFFCPNCHTCPHCCSKSACMGQTAPVLGYMGCSKGQPQGHKTLKEGYTLSFRNQPPLTRSPIILSGFVHPLKHSYLLEALHTLMLNQAIEMVKTDIPGIF